MDDSTFIARDFGRRLKHLREKAGLSQNELAKQLKVSRGAISFYENGERCPNIDFLDEVSMLFGVSYDYLLGTEETYNHVKSDELSWLSNKTIEFLRDYGDKHSVRMEDDPDVLDALLSHEDFASTMYYLERATKSRYYALKAYAQGDMTLWDNDIKYLDREYMTFNIARCLTKICEDIIEGTSWDCLSTEEKESFVSFADKKHREYEEQDKKRKAEREEEWNAREITLDEIIRLRIHEKDEEFKKRISSSISEDDSNDGKH